MQLCPSWAETPGLHNRQRFWHKRPGRALAAAFGYRLEKIETARKCYHALAAAAGVFGATRDQHPELSWDHVQPLGHILADLRHLAAATRAERAGRLDHPLDPGQMRRQMSTVALWLAGRFATSPLHRRFGLLLRGLKHALGKFCVFQGKVELVWRELLGALAEFLALRRAQDILQSTVGLLRLGQRRLDLGETGFQHGIFACKIRGFHGRK